MKASVRAIGLEIVGMVAAGNKKDGDDKARAEAIALGEALARSSWDQDATDDWDPRAAVANIRR